MGERPACHSLAFSVIAGVLTVASIAAAQPPPAPSSEGSPTLTDEGTANAPSGSQAENPPLREMSTDRPDTTESPITVDAGHFQVEVDAVSMTRDQGVTDTAVAAMNLKLG